MTQDVRGRLVLDDRVVVGRLAIEDGWIAAVDIEDEIPGAGGDLPFVAPGFVDIHVHGWGGHDAMGSPADLDGMARALLRHGVTSFLPTAVTMSLAALHAWAGCVRTWIPAAPANGAEPLGFNLEGPFLSGAKKGAHDATLLRNPADVPWSDIEPLVDGLKVVTVAPEIPGGLELIRRLASLGVRISIGHSDADLPGALAGYDAGATSTTHLFNGMSGVDHRSPGVAVAALARDDAWVELIADGQHVHPALWSIAERAKPGDRLILVSDALAMAGLGDGRFSLSGFDVDVDVRDGRCTLTDGPGTLAGSVIALDTAVRNVVRNGMSLPAAVAAASRNPLAMLGITDRGRLAVDQRADLVELDDDLVVGRVMRGGAWLSGSSVDR
jgi:N-acetylglucosamine-6-phosphate deacetylase